jgi:hypothetical protein
MENLSQICLTSWLALTIGVTLLAAYLIIAAPVARKKSNVTRYFRALAVVGAVLLVSAVPAWIGPASTGRNGRSGGNILPRVSGSPIYLYTIGMTGVSGTDNAHFNNPYGVTVNATGHVYVVDTGNHRVQVFNSDGTYQNTIGTTGASGADNAHFNTPYGVAVNATGHVYVADTGNRRVQVFDSAGTYQYTIGTTRVAGTDSAHFNTPVGVAVNATGHVFVTDYGNHRVQVFDSAGTYQYTIGMTGVSGTDNFHFYCPFGVAVNNATGYIYVTDVGNHRVQVFDSAGTYQYTIGTAGVSGTDNAHFNTPYGVAVNAPGDVYVAEYTYSPSG